MEVFDKHEEYGLGIWETLFFLGIGLVKSRLGKELEILILDNLCIFGLAWVLCLPQ